MTHKQASKTARATLRPHPTQAFPQPKHRVRTAAASDPGYPAGGIAPGLTTYGRDVRGLITSQSNSNGTNSAFSFDNNRRVTLVYHTLPGGSPLLSIGYTHDAAGNPLTKSTSSGDYVYQYDQINQLVYQQTPDGITSWTYDGAFRRVQHLDSLGLTEFAYNAAGQLLTATGARPATCVYDDNGNTTSIETVAGTFSLDQAFLARHCRSKPAMAELSAPNGCIWNDLGRLSGATLPGGQVLTITHRFDNLLSSKTGPNGTHALLWDGHNVATGCCTSVQCRSANGSTVAS